MFDTHCHLNFSRFKNRIDEVIQNALASGVDHFIVPGTDIESSKKAIEIAQKYDNVYAAVGIHPHHVFQMIESVILATTPSARGRSPESADSGVVVSLLPRMTMEIQSLEKLLENKKVVAVGEVGMDRHFYQKTKYEAYQVDEKLIKMQKELLELQIQLAIKHNKSIIFHNRETKKEIMDVIKRNWDKKLEGRTVFHCCEPDDVGTNRELSLVEFAKEHKMFIGVDGDVTYRKEKQEFIKKVPLEMLVLETDSPFLLPRPQRQQADLRGGQAEPLQFPNEPKNIKVIAEFISFLTNTSIDRLIKVTTLNARKLFNLPE